MTIVRWVWRIMMGVKNVLTLLFLLLFFGVLYAVLSSEPNPALPTNGALLVDLSGALVEQPSAGATPSDVMMGNAAAFAGEVRLRDVVAGLKTAATDKRVKAVALDLDSFIGGEPATIAEAADAIDVVRRAKKPVIAFATAYTDDSYQLAAHASEVWIDPMGGVFVTGPGGQNLYYRGLLEHLGVEAKVFRVGEFKSAVEPYVRKDQSPEAKAAAQALADSLWQGWQDDVTKARARAKILPYVNGLVNTAPAAGGNLTTVAQQFGLVDKVGDRTAWSRRLAELVGKEDDDRDDSFRAIPLANWVAATVPTHDSGNIGVVTIAGPIVDGEAGPGTAGGATIAEMIRAAIATEDLKALVLRIDSPGGSVLASEHIRRAIIEAKATRIPVIASMGGLAASGGYWVATPADTIIADPATITGSIGVFGVFPTFKGTMDKLGLATDGVRTTPYSGEPDFYRGPSPEMATIIQSGVEDIYRRFVGLVAQSRKLTPARVDEIGQGRVWAGGTAQQIGLVDRFGGLDDAIAVAAKAAGVDPDDVRATYLEPSVPWLDGLLSGFLMHTSAGQQGRLSGDLWSQVAGRPAVMLARTEQDARHILNGPAMQARCLECESLARTPVTPASSGEMSPFISLLTRIFS